MIELIVVPCVITAGIFLVAWLFEDIEEIIGGLF
jgi:hypothetical protein